MAEHRKFQVLVWKEINIEDIKEGDIFKVVGVDKEDKTMVEGIFKAQENAYKGDSNYKLKSRSIVELVELPDSKKTFFKMKRNL